MNNIFIDLQSSQCYGISRQLQELVILHIMCYNNEHELKIQLFIVLFKKGKEIILAHCTANKILRFLLIILIIK